MKILTADYLIVCDEEKNIIKNGAIVFDKKIIEIGTSEYISSKYQDIQIEQLPPHSVIMPGLINPHIHFEFSKNKSTLKYGSFLEWLYSVIENREELINSLSDDVITDILDELLNSGTTAIGAVSSYGFDLNALKNAKQSVVFFPEVLGSRADMVDALHNDFLNRFGEAQKYENENFKVGIAIHSPYSTHPVLINKVLQMAKEQQCVVQAHFMESPEEKEWLETSEGKFKEFFVNFLNQTKSLTKPDEFLYSFRGQKSVSFTHCVEASANELEIIKSLDANIIHCPFSNRLLNNTKLNVPNDINVALATDGLSSNVSLNLWDELRAALMIHTTQNLNELSRKLLYYATAGGAMVLDLPKGTLQKDFDADFLVLQLPCEVDLQSLATQIILHTNKPRQVYIKGSLC